MNILILIIGIVAGIAIGWLIARLMQGNAVADSPELRGLQTEKEQLQREFIDLDKRHSVLLESQNVLSKELDAGRDTLAEEQNRNRHLTEQLAVWRTQHQNLEEKLANQKEEMAALQDKFTTEFENVANNILEKKTATFTKQNKENLDTILNPLKERIKEFEDRIEKSYSKESIERISLKTEIKHLMEMNKQLSDDATNLANALKGESKIQGDWGELQLEMVLERAGLHRDTHYSVQSSYRNEEGVLQRPDFIIHLPEDKRLIVDSKVSLKAYEQFFSANTDEERDLFLKAHLTSVRKHIRDLGEKRYDKLYNINTPDYVLMYIPVEPAFTLAFQKEHKLFDEALRKNVVVVTNSTLMATMRTVSFIWKQENQKQNVLKIADQGTKLYEKFVLFVDSMQDIGKGLDSVRKHYDTAMNRLSEGRGNLIGATQKMYKLGLKSNKQLPKSLVNRAVASDPDLLLPEPDEETDDDA